MLSIEKQTCIFNDATQTSKITITIHVTMWTDDVAKPSKYQPKTY